MPSNKDLTDEIVKLKPDAEVDGLKNPQLEALLASLKAPSLASNNPVLSPSSSPSPEDLENARFAKAKADAELEAKAQAEANAAQEAALKGDSTHKVVPGKSVTCKREIVSGDDPEEKGAGRVSARDFHQGKIDIDRLVEAGVLVAL